MSDTNPHDTNPHDTIPLPPQSAPPAYGASPAPVADPPASPPPYSAPPAAVNAYPASPPYGAAPAYGTTAPYGAYAPVKTNTLAVVSLVSSLAGLLILPVIASIVGVITGHISLGQIKKTREQGHGLAVAGLIIGYVGVGFAVIGLIALLAFLPILFAGLSTSV